MTVHGTDDRDGRHRTAGQRARTDPPFERGRSGAGLPAAAAALLVLAMAFALLLVLS